eukprot:ANDGO_00101.mRNA.1 hypothetical protein
MSRRGTDHLGAAASLSLNSPRSSNPTTAPNQSNSILMNSYYYDNNNNYHNNQSGKIDHSSEVSSSTVISPRPPSSARSSGRPLSSASAAALVSRTLNAVIENVSPTRNGNISSHPLSEIRSDFSPTSSRLRNAKSRLDGVSSDTPVWAVSIGHHFAFVSRMGSSDAPVVPFAANSFWDGTVPFLTKGRARTRYHRHMEMFRHVADLMKQGLVKPQPLLFDGWDSLSMKFYMDGNLPGESTSESPKFDRSESRRLLQKILLKWWYFIPKEANGKNSALTIMAIVNGVPVPIPNYKSSATGSWWSPFIPQATYVEVMTGICKVLLPDHDDLDIQKSVVSDWSMDADLMVVPSSMAQSVSDSYGSTLDEHRAEAWKNISKMYPLLLQRSNASTTTSVPPPSGVGSVTPADVDDSLQRLKTLAMSQRKFFECLLDMAEVWCVSRTTQEQIQFLDVLLQVVFSEGWRIATEAMDKGIFDRALDQAAAADPGSTSVSGTMPSSSQPSEMGKKKKKKKKRTRSLSTLSLSRATLNAESLDSRESPPSAFGLGRGRGRAESALNLLRIQGKSSSTPPRSRSLSLSHDSYSQFKGKVNDVLRKRSMTSQNASASPVRKNSKSRVDAAYSTDEEEFLQHKHKEHKRKRPDELPVHAITGARSASFDFTDPLSPFSRRLKNPLSFSNRSSLEPSLQNTPSNVESILARRQQEDALMKSHHSPHLPKSLTIMSDVLKCTEGSETARDRERKNILDRFHNFDDSESDSASEDEQIDVSPQRRFPSRHGDDNSDSDSFVVSSPDVSYTSSLHVPRRDSRHAPTGDPLTASFVSHRSDPSTHSKLSLGQMKGIMLDLNRPLLPEQEAASGSDEPILTREVERESLQRRSDLAPFSMEGQRNGCVDNDLERKAITALADQSDEPGHRYHVDSEMGSIEAASFSQLTNPNPNAEEKIKLRPKSSSSASSSVASPRSNSTNSHSAAPVQRPSSGHAARQNSSDSATGFESSATGSLGSPRASATRPFTAPRQPVPDLQLMERVFSSDGIVPVSDLSVNAGISGSPRSARSRSSHANVTSAAEKLLKSRRNTITSPPQSARFRPSTAGQSVAVAPLPDSASILVHGRAAADPDEKGWSFSRRRPSTSGVVRKEAYEMQRKEEPKLYLGPALERRRAEEVSAQPPRLLRQNSRQTYSEKVESVQSLMKLSTVPLSFKRAQSANTLPGQPQSAAWVHDGSHAHNHVVHHPQQQHFLGSGNADSQAIHPPSGILSKAPSVPSLDLKSIKSVRSILDKYSSNPSSSTARRDSSTAAPATAAPFKLDTNEWEKLLQSKIGTARKRAQSARSGFYTSR